MMHALHLKTIAWTPDARSLVVSEMTSPICASLFVVSIATGQKTRLTSPPEPSIGDGWPAVSPDGSRVAYSSSRKEGGWRSLFQLTLDSGQDDELYYENLSESLYASWSPDGRSILFTQCPSNEPCNLRILSLDGGREWRQYLQPA